MKQTAVEWLANEFYEKLEVKGDGALFNDLVNQAKKIEKQQMIEMHDKGFDSVEQLNDDFAIEFAEWCVIRKVSFFDDTEQGMIFTVDLYKTKYTTKELLQIYKIEKGL